MNDSHNIPEYVPCSNCGQAPVDPFDVAPPDCSDCVSNSGKYYDVLTHSFTMPAAGGEGKLYVCDPSLWAACQWVGICAGSGAVAALRITGIVASDKSLVVYNGCQGSAIPTNPAPGTTFDRGTALYPISPKCDDANQSALTQLSNAINALETVCYSKVTATSNDVEGYHLFAGTFGEGQNETSDPSFWTSCYRKIRGVWLGMFGRTFCFKNFPFTTEASTIIGDTTYPKRTVLFDTYGNCLKAGPPVGEAAFCNAAPLEADGDGNEYFDKIIVCKDNVKKGIEAKVGYGIVGIEDEDGNIVWSHQVINQGDEYLAAFQEIVPAANIANGTYNYEYTPTADKPEWANYAIVELFTSIVFPTSSGSIVSSTPVGPSDQYLVLDRCACDGDVLNIHQGVHKLKTFDDHGKIKLRLVISGTGGTKQYGLKHVGWAS